MWAQKVIEKKVSPVLGGFYRHGYIELGLCRLFYNYAEIYVFSGKRKKKKKASQAQKSLSNTLAPPIFFFFVWD